MFVCSSQLSPELEQDGKRRIPSIAKKGKAGLTIEAEYEAFLPVALTSSVSRVALRRGPSQNAPMRVGPGLATVALVAAVYAMPIACSGGDGFVAGPVEGVPSSCEDDTFLVVTPAQCPASACIGTSLFAVCQDGGFVGCACSRPPGNEENEGGLDSDSAFVEDSESCSIGVESGECIDDAMTDGPLFDTGDLGDCSGMVAQRVYPCGACKGDGYALCDGLTFSRCSCELPPGYTLLDAGVLDGGPVTQDAGFDADNGSIVEDAELDL